MIKEKHEINFGSGYVTVPAPKNIENAEVDVIFTKDQARASFANLTLVWQGATAKKIYDVFIAGSNGGKGVSSALPYRITLCDTIVPPFEMMLVMGHSTARFSCDHVELPAWKAQGEDWFQMQTNGYSFWYLWLIGDITTADYKKVPYCLTSIPNYTQIVSCSLSFFILFWQTRQLILEFSDHSTEIAAGDLPEAAIPIVGTPHVLVLVVHCVSIILRIAYIASMILLMFQLAKDLQDNIIQRKKYKLGMTELDCFKKLAAFLQLNGFSSSIYAPGSKYENATGMPQKIVMPKDSQTILDNVIDSLFDRPENEINNSKSYGYPDGTFAEFILKMETKYNAECKIINGVLFFEEKHFWNVSNPYRIANTGDVGYTLHLPGPVRTNLSELAPNTEVKFLIDPSDATTLHRYKGTTAAVQIVSPFPVNKFSGWGAGRIIEWGEALAKRKQFTNKIENALDLTLQVVHDIVQIIITPINLIIQGLNAIISGINAVINVLNNTLNFNIGNVNPIPLLNNPIPLNVFQSRIGWMEISGDSFSIPKTFIGVDVGGDWELHPNTEDDMSAISLLNDFHGKELATRGNQYLLYDNNKTRFCCADFQKIQSSNVLVTPDGTQGKFDSMKWNLKQEEAREIHYRIQQTYLSGLSEKVIIDGTV